MESKKTKNAIWIDEKINSKNINSIFQELEYALLNFNIYKCESVKETFKLIEKKYNKFQFKLIYIIVNEELWEEFIKVYMGKKFNYTFISYNCYF